MIVLDSVKESEVADQEKLEMKVLWRITESLFSESQLSTPSTIKERLCRSKAKNQSNSISY